MMEKSIIHVEGMSCQHCQEAVMKALQALQGVESAEVSLKDKSATISYNAELVTLEDIKQAVEQQGYDIVFS